MVPSLWNSLKAPIIGLAPMHDVTTYMFRELQCEIAKPDVIYTELISAEGLARVPDKFTAQLSYSPIQRPIVVQLFGSDPQAFSKAITVVHRLGFDGIDINMGCPAPKVLKVGGGGALIGNYAKVDKLITTAHQMANKCGVPLSLKTRIVSDPKQNTDWFTFLANYPIAAITIHGRYVKQEHSGEVNWDSVSASSHILKQKGIIVLGNGGIKDINEGKALCHKYNLDGFLIGQAAIGNPYAFSNEVFTTATRIKVLKLMVQLLTAEIATLTMTRVHQFVFLALKGWPNISILKQLIVRQSDVKSVIETLNHYVSNQPQYNQ